MPRRRSAGDVDGDGDGDLVHRSGDTGGSVLASPLPSVFGWDSAALVDAELTPVGDVDGDGAVDFLTRIGPEGEQWYALALSPLGPAVDPDATIPIAPLSDGYPMQNLSFAAYADLDGDGRSDIVTREDGNYAEGIVAIWYAADLLGERR